MANRIFKNRLEAGRALVKALRAFTLEAPIVLGVPRGGVPVASEIARALNAPLDVIVVRKLGLPMEPEVAIGAIALGGVRVLNHEIIAALMADDPVALEQVVSRESRELSRREQLYRGARPFPELLGRDVLLVDDGMATGATMLAAVQVVQSQQPSRIIVAIPVAAKDALRLLEGKVDRVLCLDLPEPFRAVGDHYQRFDATTDEEVRQLLQTAATPDQGP